jgi:cell division protein FtsI (penicillin-binding protein 3)
MLYPPIDPAARRRAKRLVRFLILWGVIIFGRLVYLQIYRHEHYTQLADKQHIHRVEIAAHRGIIYDRNGHILAITIPTERVIVDPARLPNIPTNAAIVAGILGLDANALTAELTNRAQRATNNRYYVIAPHVHPEQAQRLRSLRLNWLYFKPSSYRVYPNGGLAAHVLGGVDADGHGNAGIEQGLEEELGGYSGFANMVSDVSNRGFESEIEAEPVPGNDVVLTLDHRIQYDLEQELAAAVAKNDCKSGRGIVMDPSTGEILALASYPTYDPNEKVTNLESRRNLAVQSAIEPGSVFKVFTIAGAIEDGLVTPGTGYHCGNGRINLFGRVIHDAHSYGYLSVEDILAKSSNIGSIHVALELKEKRFYDYIKLFGFGDRTGLPLPGESPGRVIRLAKWTKSSIGSVAMGHEIMATTAQLAQAASVIANGGRLVKPRIVQRVRPNELSPYQIRKAAYEWPTAEGKPILSPRAVVTMRNMMDRVVAVGTGKEAKIKGYSSGGKTGSAQIFDPKTGAYLHRYHASFMGFAPMNNPRVVVVITLDGASKYGGVVAAPVFKAVAGSALRTLNVPTDLPVVEEPESVPPVILSDLAYAELTEQKPVETVDNSEVIETKSTLITPDFLGKPLRDVLAEASRQGFRINPAGSGLVRSQNPAPGSPISYGQKIELRLGR